MKMLTCWVIAVVPLITPAFAPAAGNGFAVRSLETL